jgi:hypothetical protein
MMDGRSSMTLILTFIIMMNQTKTIAVRREENGK